MRIAGQEEILHLEPLLSVIVKNSIDVILGVEEPHL
jgi:hypothetical protein